MMVGSAIFFFLINYKLRKYRDIHFNCMTKSYIPSYFVKNHLIHLLNNKKLSTQKAIFNNLFTFSVDIHVKKARVNRV